MANFYQYEPPVAMFSMAEMDEYSKAHEGYAAFGIGDALATPFRAVGGWAAKGMRGVANRAAQRLDDPTVTKLGINANKRAQKLGEMAGWAEKNTGKVGAGIVGAGATLGAAGVGGVMFTRRRRSKNGKIIVEQVRR